MNKIIWPFCLIVMSIGFFQFQNVKSAEAIEGSATPVVLELFTSQSCSSCPPADKVLGDLADKHDNIIALSCNVTYWNHLHWKDTLSKDFCTERQRSYAQSFSSKRVYTPQIVINGQHEMVGSRGNAVRNRVAKAVEKQAVKVIAITSQGETLQIKLPEIVGNDSFALHLITHGARHTQSIPSGENRGRTVQYTNPVQDIISLGTWDGTSKVITYDVSEIKNASGFVILAQKNGVTGPIAAAGKIKP